MCCHLFQYGVTASLHSVVRHHTVHRNYNSTCVEAVLCCCFQDVMDEFFSDRDDPEGALWQGLLYTFVGLGALAAMAAVR